MMKENEDQELRRRIACKTREELAEILEAQGFQCYDEEGKEELVEALFVNIEDGTIDESVLDDE